MLVVVLAAAGCTGQCRPGGSVVGGRVADGDRDVLVDSGAGGSAVAVEVCGLANAATATTTTVFNERSRPSSRPLSATTRQRWSLPPRLINEQFQSATEAFTQLSERQVDSAAEVLVEIAGVVISWWPTRTDRGSARLWTSRGRGPPAAVRTAWSSIQ